MRLSIGFPWRIQALLVALAWSIWLPARAVDGELVGVWKGRWYLGMTSGTAILTLGTAESTLEMTNNEKFGTAPVPLADVAVDKRALNFRAIGEDGLPLVAKLPLSNDNTGLRGYARYGGFRLLLDVARSPDR